VTFFTLHRLRVSLVTVIEISVLFDSSWIAVCMFSELDSFRCSGQLVLLRYTHAKIGFAPLHPCKDCVWPIILGAGFNTTFPGERVLVVMTHQVQCNIPTFEAVLRKNIYLFLERRKRSNNVMVACFDAVRLFLFFLIL